MQDFFATAFAYEGSEGQYIDPTGLKNMVKKKFFPMMQHDSHEFLMHILSCL